MSKYKSILTTRKVDPVNSLFSRTEKRESMKLIFISCEGPVTEEVYFFDIVTNIFEPIKDKIKPVSAREDFFATNPTLRTQSDLDEQNKSSPRQVMERMDAFLSKGYYDIKSNKDDEFWLVLDIDDHTSTDKAIEWNKVLTEAQAKGYQFAVSNPFFEAWLLMHHDDVSEDDKGYGVTELNTYSAEFQNHFTNRLAGSGAPLIGKNNKVPLAKHYNKDKIQQAIERAQKLLVGGQDWPRQFGTTVYIILEKLTEMLSEKLN